MLLLKYDSVGTEENKKTKRVNALSGRLFHE